MVLAQASIQHCADAATGTEQDQFGFRACPARAGRPWRDRLAICRRRATSVL